MFKKNALLSVYNKEGVVEFAQELIKLGWKIIASGGTAKKLKEANLEVQDVADLVGASAILGHRVVTLSREVHAGLLARPIDVDLAELEKLGIPFIDLVCVGLYPLEAEIAKPDAAPTSVTEMTDIGGPTMLRSAAKGRRIVICNPSESDYEFVVDELTKEGDISNLWRQKMAALAEFEVARYCLTSTRYISFNEYDGSIGQAVRQCKYGENAWQAPAYLFRTDQDDPLALSQFQLVTGTAPSYNNLCDVDRLLQTMTHIAAAFDLNNEKVPCIAVAVKHGNACGAAVGDNPLFVLEKTVMGDPQAIFGGLVMTNFSIDEINAEVLLKHGLTSGKRLLDGVIAPNFTEAAITFMKRKVDRCRFLKNPTLANLSRSSIDKSKRFRFVRGGFLSEPNYTYVLNLSDLQIELFGRYTEQHKKDLLLAWAINATSNSNTITLVKNSMLLGNGVGQQDRVTASELAIKKAGSAGHDLADAVAVSDSFFPFPDGPERLIEAGIKVIFATSGSIRDDVVKDVITRADVTLLRLPDVTARGFFGH